jgi:type I restriction enzyme S subunit
MAAVSEDGYIAEEQERQLGDVVKGYTYFERGDVLIAKITPCVQNGKAAHATELKHDIGFGTTEFHVLRPGPRVDGRYLFYIIWNPAFRHLAEQNMTGSAGQKRVPADFVKRFPIPLPPLPEQKRIAAILDQADGIRRKRSQMIDATTSLVCAIFCDLFGDPGSNPKEWPIVCMGDVVVESQYGTSSSLEVDQRGYPVLRMNNITYGGEWDLADLKWLDFTDDELPKYTVRQGDLLFNRTNSPELVGKTAIWSNDEVFAFAGYLIRFRFDHRRVLPEFISAYLNSGFGKSLLFRSAVPSNNMSNISASTFRRLPLMLPCLRSQQEFVDSTQQVRAAVDRQRRAATESCSLYQSLARQAFQGQR